MKVLLHMNYYCSTRSAKWQNGALKEEWPCRCVRGYHICNWVWTATVEEVMRCARESGGPLSSQCAFKEGKILSKICSLYYWHGCSISCGIAGARQYSRDLHQGGIEVPCVLILKGSKEEVVMVKSFYGSALKVFLFFIETLLFCKKWMLLLK